MPIKERDAWRRQEIVLEARVWPGGDSEEEARDDFDQTHLVLTMFSL